MENILNQIREGLGSIGLPYISQSGAFLFLLTVLLILLFILWMVFRKIRLWYWKTDSQINTLKNIDNHLINIKEALKQNPEKNTESADNGKHFQSGNIDLPKCESIPENLIPEEQGMIAIGKSGKVYTEAELELQIRE